jgi:RNA polymerase-binding transcription factor DksA
MKRDCVQCGEPIPQKRLEAKPNTYVCVECQSKREDNGEFRRSTMETHQEISGWQFEGVKNTLIKGEE